MEKVRTTFYLNREHAELLRDLSYQTRKPMTALVKEALELLKKEYENEKKR